MIFIGDVHGQFSELEKKLRGFTATTFIQVGDFGLGYYENEKEILEQLEYALKINNNKMYVIRGNHDNPNTFKKLQNENPYKHLIFPKECSVHEIENKKVFFCGGAGSINKADLKKDIDWWEDEKINIKDLKYSGKFDVCITHSCHHEIPIIMNFSLSDELKKYIENVEQRHLRDIQRVVEMNGCKAWFFGHYHNYLNTIYNNVKYVCVAPLELFEYI